MPGIIYGLNNDPKYFSVTYYDNGDLAKRAALAAQWKRFDRLDPSTGQTFNLWYRRTYPQMQVTIDHLLPVEAPAGRYRVETFIPAQHATTRKALLTLAHNFRLRGDQSVHDEPVILINQYELFDAWYALGEFDLDSGREVLSGRVRQFDLSLETPAPEVCFGPVRWVPVSTWSGERPRFDAPVGTQAERDGALATGGRVASRYPLWVGNWIDYNPFLSWYEQGCHTGADLNIVGAAAADKGKPIYSIGDGSVIYAGAAGTWGNIIVIKHPQAVVTLPYGQTQRQAVYSRYGHVDKNILVRKGQTVTRGQPIGFIGVAAPQDQNWHLHFDISYTDLLQRQPAHWPNLTNIRSLQSSSVSRESDAFKKAQAAVVKEVVSHYLDPLKFLKENHSGG